MYRNLWNIALITMGVQTLLNLLIGVSFSKPYHMSSTVKSVFLLDYVIYIIITAESCVSTNHHYIKHVHELNKC